MWDCIKCGVRAIAGTLGFCPGCFEPKEDDVPKATSAGASNASAEPGEPGYIDPAADEVAAARALLGPGGPADKAKGEPEKPAAAPAQPKAAVPVVDLRPPAAASSAPAADKPAPAADKPADTPRPAA